MSKPWGLRFGHPHEVHVTGQHGDVRAVLVPIGIAGVAAGEQNIDDQLQVGLPSDRLPKQNNSRTLGLLSWSTTSSKGCFSRSVSMVMG